MNVTFACPQCDRTTRAEVAVSQESLSCSHCQTESLIPPGALEAADEGGIRVQRCLVCPSHELFVRKDFSQRLGILIIGIGFLASTITWACHLIVATFAILFSTALLDVVLYLVVGNLLQCYRCRAEYRGVADLDRHAAFSLETHERYRQQAARLAEHRD